MTDDIRERVLVVEDEPMGVMLLARILKEAECDVVVAKSGEEALSHVDNVDMVILDVMLPGIDGYEVARSFKASHTGEGLPIIFVSGHSKSVDKARAFEAGATDYITKPFDIDEIRLRIDNQIRIARLQRRVARQNEDLRQKNLELERFVEAIRAREPSTSESARGGKQAGQADDSLTGLDRVFTALSEVLPGTVLDKRYQLESMIGSGGFGAVYRAQHLVLDRPVAVKVLQPPRGPDADEQLKRFRSEAMSAYRFNHPNAVGVLDASVSSSGLPYIVMELLEGWSLREEIQNSGRIGHARCAEIMVPVCDVISRAHRAGFTHRDIKPDNIFIDFRDGVETIKVLDFGLAKLHQGSERSPHEEAMIIGTPPYMAPECFSGSEPAPEKIDVYAIAVVTFEALAGRLPFAPGPGGLAALINQHLSEPPPRLRDLEPDIPPLLENLVLAGLEKKAESRPAARAFGEQLVIAALSDDESLSPEDERTLRLRPLDNE